jgi:8-oxo-dGTP pyrophosphatase MutT (NUDIX family)/ketosteroid isomerase-like protein
MTDRRAFSVSIFARHRGRVLLVAHRGLGTWLPVGGEVEPGETPLDAARRELLEETGLRGVFPVLHGIDGAPPGLLGYEEHPAGDKGTHLNFSFVADVASDQVTPNDEFGEHGWFDDAAAIGCPPNVRQLARLAVHAGESPLVALARRWLHAFNARDLEGLLALYADDAEHTSPKLRARHPETEGRVRGKAALRAWWADAMERLPALRYEELHLTASGERVFMEYDRVNPGEASFVVAEVLVVRGGVIVASAVYHG